MQVDEIDLAVMRAANDSYGPALAALDAADLTGVRTEPDMDPSRPPRDWGRDEPAGPRSGRAVRARRVRRARPRGAPRADARAHRRARLRAQLDRRALSRG